MEHLIRSLKVFWRAERLLGRNELRLLTKKTQLNALAGLVAVFGLVMLSLSAFFALVPYLGQALAALAVGTIDIVLALLLVSYAGRLNSTEDVAMIREVRDMAIKDIEVEVARTEAELVALKNDARKFIRNPLDALLPSMIIPLVGALTKGLRSTKKQPEKPVSDRPD